MLSCRNSYGNRLIPKICETFAIAGLLAFPGLLMGQQNASPAAPFSDSRTSANSGAAASPSAGQTSTTTPSSASAPAPGGQAASTTSSATAAPAEELSAHDEVTTFKVKVNLVLVRVVVRDGKGNSVGGLHQEDFELLDNGKAQSISQFEVQGAKMHPETKTATVEAGAYTTAPPATPVIPVHFVAYVFDDVHTDFGDLVQVRDAASRHLDTLGPTDRAAIFTTSGQGNLDFTDDRVELRKALGRLRPTPVARVNVDECPQVTHYVADLIVNRNDINAFNMVFQDAWACAFHDDSRFVTAAQNLAQSAANRALTDGEHESRLALSVFQDVLRRIAVMPGQRTVLVMSPGFITRGLEADYLDLIDRALRSQVVVSTLNPRGLFVDDSAGDVSKTTAPNQAIAVQRQLYQSESNFLQEVILRDLAEGTGGSYFHNSNDLFAGFQRIASTPEYYYLLGFSPQNLKLDGHFHTLKVVVKNPPKLTVQARRGYYAPSHPADAAQEAKQQIEDALFSQEELHDLPIDLHTQFFKATDTEAQLAVLVHIDARHLRYNRDQGRNANQLTIVSGLFDRNGKFITANEKVLDMHWKDETLASKLNRGVTLKSNFDVKPGAYVVRLVVRDAGGQISAANGSIEIP